MPRIKRTMKRGETRRKKHMWAAQMRKNPTPAEALLWEALKGKQLGVRFRRQALISGYIADFWCPSHKIVVECDGSSHNGREDWDRWRDNSMADKGITVLRFKNERVFSHLDDVISIIRSHIHTED